MAIRTIKAAGGTWGTVSTWVEGIIPTESDDVVCEAGSGTISLTYYGYCRSLDLTGFTGIINGGSYMIYIGTTTNRADLVAVYIPDAVTYSSTIRFTLYSKSAEYVTLRTGINNTQMLTIDAYKGNYTVLSDIYVNSLYLSGQVALNPLNFNMNGKTLNVKSYFEINYLYTNVNLAGATVNFINEIQTAYFNVFAGTVVDFSNLVLNAYSASFSVTINLANPDLGSTSINILGTAVGVISIFNTCTIANFRFLQSVAKSFSVTVGKTFTVTGQFICKPKTALVNISGGTINKPSGIVNLYNVTNNTAVFGGGATWIGRNNCTSPDGKGIDLQGGNCYVDHIDGNDSLFLAYGWWKVAYTLAAGAYPAEGETAIGGVSGSTCKITGLVDDYDWATGSGILYFYAKSAPFQAETVNLSGGGSFVIAGDLVNSAWKTGCDPLQAGKISLNDKIKYSKTPDPVSTGVMALWNSTTAVGNIGLAAILYITSSSNTSPIVITKATHLYQTGAFVFIIGHTVNTNANGVWQITRLTDNTFSLDGSVGNGVGPSTGQIHDATSKIVILDTPVTADVCNCDLAWTPGTNVTSALLDNSSWKFSAGSIKIITGAACGANQILAKYALAADLDLSGYEQLSFWFKNTTSAMAIGDLVLKLYSDAACTVEVESLPLPATPAIGQWWPIVLNKGAALSATVRGVALYTTIIQASKTFNIDNIIACKNAASPDSITHQSYISKNIPNQDGDDVFLAIQGIKDCWVFLDTITLTTPIAGRGYCGITERVMLYKKESHKTTLQSSMYTWGMQLRKPGVLGKNIKYSGGWNKDTNLLDGYTHYDGTNGFTYALFGNYFNDVENFHFSRYVHGIRDVHNGTIKNIISTNNTGGISITYKTNDVLNVKALFGGGISLSGGFDTCSGCVVKSYNDGMNLSGSNSGNLLNIVVENTYFGLVISTGLVTVVEITKLRYNYYGLYPNGHSVKIGTIKECSYNYTGIYFLNHNCRINLIEKLNYNYYGVNFSGSNNVIKEITQLNNSFVYAIQYSDKGMENGVLRITSADSNKALASIYNQFNSYIYNASFTNTIQVPPISFSYANHFLLKNCTGFPDTMLFGPQGINSKLYSHNHNNSGTHKIFVEQGVIESATDQRHTASGVSWKFSVFHILRNINFPLNLSVAKIACNAGKTTTVAIWAKLSHEVNIGGMLLVEGDKYGGIGPSNIYAETDMTTEWQQMFIEFTPTYTDVVEVLFWVFYKSGTPPYSVWIDDVSIIEAP